MSSIKSEIGQRIRNYRVQQGLSQEALSEKCGLHPTYIGQLERGEKNATLESIEKVAAGLSVPLSQLFEHLGIQSDDPDYPLEAYRLLQELPEPEQLKLLGIIRAITEFKNI